MLRDGAFVTSWDPRIARAVLHAERHLEDSDADLSLEGLARRAHLSPFHFHRLFRATIGEPVSSWVRRLRMERAAMLLRHTRRPLHDVAFSCGYATQAAFTRAFSRHMGRSPGAWRGDNAVHLWSGEVDDTLEVVELPALRVLWRRHVGDWPGLDARIAEVCRRFDEEGLYRPDTRMAVMIYDEPDVTALEAQRVDIGLTLPPEADLEGWDVRSIPSGRAAVLDLEGDYARFELAALDFAYRLFPAAGLVPDSDYLLALTPGLHAWRLAEDLEGALAEELPFRIVQPLAG